MSYWTEVDPPMSFIPEGWTYEQKREFRFKELDYLREVADFASYRGMRVLCIGDGGGIDALEFARTGATVEVIDLSAKAVALTRQHASEANIYNLSCAVGDACNLPFGRNAFDAVYSFGVFHHIPNVDKAVAEVARVLKPNGVFLGMVYNRDSLYYAHSILARAAREGLTAEQAMQKYSERNPGCPHSVAYSKEELWDLLGPHFSAVVSFAHYDVIDTPKKRKVRYSIDGEGGDLGWHRFFHALK